MPPHNAIESDHPGDNMAFQETETRNGSERHVEDPFMQGQWRPTDARSFVQTNITHTADEASSYTPEGSLTISLLNSLR